MCAARVPLSFKKFLDHRRIVLDEPIGALAQQLGRAYAMQGAAAKARAAYQEFLTSERRILAGYSGLD